MSSTTLRLAKKRRSGGRLHIDCSALLAAYLFVQCFGSNISAIRPGDGLTFYPRFLEKGRIPERFKDRPSIYYSENSTSRLYQVRSNATPTP